MDSLRSPRAVHQNVGSHPSVQYPTSLPRRRPQAAVDTELTASAKARRTHIHLRSPIRNHAPQQTSTSRNQATPAHEAIAVALMKAYEEDQSRIGTDYRAFSPLLSATVSTVAMRTANTSKTSSNTIPSNIAPLLEDSAMLQAQIKSLRFYSMGPPRLPSPAPAPWAGNHSGTADVSTSYYSAQDLPLATRFANIWNTIDAMRRLDIEESRPHLQYSSAYLETGIGITVGMRAVLIDWMVDVHQRFRLKPPTLHLSVALLDRFLSSRPVDANGIQLIGCAALCIASKYEEIRAPLIRDFAWVTDDFYTKQQIQAMEALILDTLSFKIASPTILNYATEILSLFQMTCQQDGNATITHRIEPSVFAKLKFILEFVCESTIQTPLSLQFSRRELAAACFCVSLQMMRNEFPHCWNVSLSLYTGMSLEDFEDAEMMVRSEMASMSSKTMTASRDKYCRAEYMGVGVLSPSLDSTTLIITKKAILDALNTLGVKRHVFDLVRWLRVDSGRIVEVLAARPISQSTTNDPEIPFTSPAPAGSVSSSINDNLEYRIRWVQHPESVYQLQKGGKDSSIAGVSLPLENNSAHRGGKSGGKNRLVLREREREITNTPVLVLTRWIDREILESIEGGSLALAQFHNRTSLPEDQAKLKDKEKGCMKCSIM